MTDLTFGDQAIQRIRQQRGLLADIAFELGLREQTVRCWRSIPIEYTFDVARVTKIPPEQLRPDFFLKDPLRARHIPHAIFPRRPAVPQQRKTFGRPNKAHLPPLRVTVRT